MARTTSPAKYALLLLLPMAVGAGVSVGVWSIEWQWCAAAVALLSLVYWFRPGHVDRGRSFERHITWLAFLAPAYVAFQLVPLPLPVLRLLSPERAELVEALGAVMPAPWLAPISVEPTSSRPAERAIVSPACCPKATVFRMAAR